MEHINEKLKKLDNTVIKDWAPIKNITKEAVAKFVYSKTKRNPVILPIVMEI